MLPKLIEGIQEKLEFYLERSEPVHPVYLVILSKKDYYPVADRTGGLISFVSTNLEDATAIIMQDPFLTENLIENKWIKEWIVE